MKTNETRSAKRFVMSGREVITNKHHAKSWAELILFYGVPRWAKYWYRDLASDDVVFTDKLLEEKP